MNKIIALGCVLAAITASGAAASPNTTSVNQVMQVLTEDVTQAGQAPNMPSALRLKAQRSWRVFLGERRLSGVSKTCKPKPVWSARTFRNLAGQTLWVYYQQVYFCYTGKLVTYFYRTRWAEVKSVLPIVEWKPWEFQGHIGNSCEGEHCFIRGYRAASRTAWTQGKFEVCAVKFAFCNYENPIVGITVRGDGSFTSFSRGG